MDNPINYTAEARRINDLVSMEDRENAYASLASRLRDERDARDTTITKLLEIIRNARGNYFGSITAYERACEITGRAE